MVKQREDDDFVREDPLGDDGYEVDQCPIRMTHPMHLWGATGGIEKMCEGVQQ